VFDTSMHYNKFDRTHKWTDLQNKTAIKRQAGLFTGTHRFLSSDVF